MDEKQKIPIGARGPCGEHHHKAKLSDEDIEMIRLIYDEGFLGYRAIARAFGVRHTVIRNIVKYRRRATLPIRYVDAVSKSKR